MLLLRRRFSALFAACAALVALAVANPFCCHLLPAFAAEAVQTETAFDARDACCAGKPEAVHEDVLAVPPPPPLAVWWAAVVPVSVLAPEVSRVESGCAAAPPRTIAVRDVILRV